jgi:hypothetical protein
MATAQRAEQGVGYEGEALGERTTGVHDESKWSLLTTEFWAMVLVIAAILIATAVSDSLNDTRGWLLVTIVATGYIVSRGIAKAGVGHLPPSASRRRTS